MSSYAIFYTSRRPRCLRLLLPPYMLNLLTFDIQGSPPK